MPARGATEFPWSVFITGIGIFAVIVFGFLMYFLRNVGELEEIEKQDNLLKGQGNPEPPDDPESEDDQPETKTTLLGTPVRWLIIIGIIAALCYIWIRKITS